MPDELELEMPDGPVVTAGDEQVEAFDLGVYFAAEASRYLSTVRDVASGLQPATAIPVLLMAVSEILAAGSRLGASKDVVPPERFEPDAGPDDPALDPLRLGLANVLDGLDEYVAIPDPVLGGAPEQGSLAGDLAEVAAALSKGMQHLKSGRLGEALWWWQFSYLSSWAEAGAGALRVLVSLLSHARLDVDDEVAADAEFHALHP